MFCPEERGPRAAVARWHIYNKEWWRSSAACRPHPAVSPSAGTHGNGRCRVKSTLHRPLGCSSPPAREWRKQRRKGLALAVYFVRNGQFLAALGTTSGQYAATISRLHALTETMLVVSLPVVGLECSFHFCILVFVLWLVHDRAFGVLRSSGCKVTKIIPFGETFTVFFCTPFLRLATS